MQHPAASCDRNSLRVLLVSHIYLEPRYRAKLDYLASSVQLQLASPDRFPSAYGMRVADFPTGAPYRVRTYPCWFPLGFRSSTRWILASRDLGLGRYRADIIHVENEAHSFSLVQAVFYRRLYARQARLIVSVWANHRVPGLKGRILDLFARLLRHEVDHYIAGNTDGKALLVQSGVPHDRITILPLVGTDTRYFQPASPDVRAQLRAKLGISQDEFVVGYAGRLVPDKGIRDLLRAFYAFRDHTANRPLRLLLIGNGPLKQQLLAHSPTILVESPGGSSTVLPYYHMMDVLVLPSRTTRHWKEQFGQVLAEAMASGTPVIGSDSGSIPQVIGDAGLIFPEGDVAALTEVLARLAADAELRQVLTERGRCRVASVYSAEQVAIATYRVYEHTVSLAR